MQKALVFILTAVFFVCNPYHLFAQTTQASFTGKITDTENKPLTGASIKIKNESTGFSSTTISNTKGDYVFKELPLGGPYTIFVYLYWLSRAVVLSSLWMPPLLTLSLYME